MKYCIACFNRKPIFFNLHWNKCYCKTSQAQPVICITHLGRCQETKLCTPSLQMLSQFTLWRKDKWVLEPNHCSTLKVWVSPKPEEVMYAHSYASSLWILQRKPVPCSYFPLMCLLGLPILGLKALSRTPAIIALVVLLLSVVVLVAITLIQFHHKEVLLPGLKVSAKGLALKGWAMTSIIVMPWVRRKPFSPPPVGEDPRENPRVFGVRPKGGALDILVLWHLTLENVNGDTFSKDCVALLSLLTLGTKARLCSQELQMATKGLPAYTFPQDHTTLIMSEDQETQPPLLA